MPAARRVRFLPVAIRKVKEQVPFLFASLVLMIAVTIGTLTMITILVHTRNFARRAAKQAIEAGWMG